ncbi:polysaccharide pyruvyl transferase family protein [Paenibacillus senegalensis]|uniref:polysaccharide pyruvyl transferase family protein n=1 Tax=Paenibacillus senegalensis TaxID=1465766 RepID=UPI000287C9DB|nr:polysaccharide pyruvyl transferase family protein [Paenibacillus senegalensis]
MAAKIVIHGFYGAGNTGDDAILQAIVDHLYDRLEDPQVTVLVRSRTTKAYYGRHPVQSVYGFEKAAVATAVAKADAILIGGGGLFQDYTGYEAAELFAGAKRSINYYAAPFFLAKAWNKPVMFYAVGVGPFHSPLAANMSSFILSSSDAVTVRDQASLDMARKLNIHQAVLTADPALRLTSHISENAVRKWAPSDFFNAGHPLIGLNLRKWSFTSDGTPKCFTLLKQLADYSSAKYNAKFLILPFNLSDQEQSLAVRLAESIGRDKAHIVASDCPPDQLQRLIGQLDILLHMRLHASILAAASGTPTIGIAYDPKVNHWYKEMGLEEMCFELGEVELTTLRSRLDEVLLNKQIWRERFKGRAKLLIQREERNSLELDKLLTPFKKAGI